MQLSLPIRQVKIIDGRKIQWFTVGLLLLLLVQLRPVILRIMLLSGLPVSSAAAAQSTSPPLLSNPLGCSVRTGEDGIDDLSTASGGICAEIRIPMPDMFVACSHNHTLLV